MIEHYSHKIQNAIQRELFKANKSIKIAVAWFTNDLLFQPLLLQLSAGVTVEIVLNKDEINCSDKNEIDFDEFVNAGGILRWNTTKRLMHDKFCIIDDRIVIFGSYNWTNKAEYNEESIAIARDEENTINSYLEKFSNLSHKYPKQDTTTKDSSIVEEDKKETVFEKSPSDGKPSKEKRLYYTDPSGAVYSKDFFVLYKGADIKDFKIDGRTREIKENAFLGFKKLEKISINNIIFVGDNAFEDCRSLKYVSMDLSRSRFGKNVFENCTSLVRISNINSWRGCLGTITSGMFKGCLSLETFNFDNIETIEDGAFEGCVSLKKVDLPIETEIIGRRVFYGCHSLKEVSFPVHLRCLGGESFAECKSIEEIKIPKLIKKIKSDTFADCTSLRNIELPNLSCIESCAFSNCVSLQQISIPNSVKRISRDVFDGCISLRQISLPDSIRTYGALDAPAYIPLSNKIVKHMMVNKLSTDMVVDSGDKNIKVMSLGEKNRIDRENSNIEVVCRFSSSYYSPELNNINDGEILTIPDDYTIFRHFIEQYQRSGFLSVLNKKAFATEYINVLTNTGYIVEFHPIILLKSKGFVVDGNGKYIRENGHLKGLGYKTDVLDFVRKFSPERLGDAIKAMRGCQIKCHYINRIRVLKYGVPESAATSRDVMTVDAVEWSFVGEKRPIGFYEEDSNS